MPDLASIIKIKIKPGKDKEFITNLKGIKEKHDQNILQKRFDLIELLGWYDYSIVTIMDNHQKISDLVKDIRNMNSKSSQEALVVDTETWIGQLCII